MSSPKIRSAETIRENSAPPSDLNSQVSSSASPTSALTVTTIRPARGWSALELGQLWQFRDLFWTLAVRDVKLRYRQTALGAIWVVIQPLMTAGLLTFIFGTVAKLPSEGVPYFVLALSGQLGWNIFAGTLGKASGSIVAHSGMISKVYFPRMLLPLSSIVGSLLDFCVGFIALVALLIFYGITPEIQFLLLPFWILILLMLGVGLGLTTSALMVTYRDVGHVLPVLMTMLMYASAVPYSLKVALERSGPQFHIFFFLNPLSGVIEGLRWSLLSTPAPQWQYVLYSAVCAVVVLFGGLMLFKRLESNFADVI